MIGRQARYRSQDPCGAASRCDTPDRRNAGQDNRITRMVPRGGAAGPDDLKRMSQGGVRHSVNPGPPAFGQREPGLARSQTLGKVVKADATGAAMQMPRPPARTGYVSPAARGAADGPHRGGKPLRGLRKQAFDDQTQAQWEPTAMSAPVLRFGGPDYSFDRQGS